MNYQGIARLLFWSGFSFMVGSSSPAASQVPFAAVPEQKGVVVEEVVAGSALERAGAQAGDILLAWERLSDPPQDQWAKQRDIRSIYDWFWLTVDESETTIRLSGKRNGESVDFEVSPGSWKSRVRPRFPIEVASAYLEGEKVLASNTVAATDLWEKLAANTEFEMSSYSRSWLYLRIARAFIIAGDRERAWGLYGSALNLVHEDTERVAIWQLLGEACEVVKVPDAAPDSGAALYSAGCLKDFGEMGQHLRPWLSGLPYRDIGLRNRLVNQVIERLEAALEIYRDSGFEGIDVADSYYHLWQAHRRKEDSTKGAHVFRARALALYDQLPQSSSLAERFLRIAVEAHAHGDSGERDRYFSLGVKMCEELAPDSTKPAMSLLRMANFSSWNGDSALVEEYYKRAVGFFENRGLRDGELARVLVSYSRFMEKAGDNGSAEQLLRRALGILEEIEPGNPQHSYCLDRLGDFLARTGDMEQAQVYWGAALQIEEEVHSESLLLAHHLAYLASRMRKYPSLRDETERHRLRAHKLYERFAPRSSHFARSLQQLANTASKNGNFEVAKELLEQSVAVQAEIQPGSIAFAESLKRLCRFYADGGDLTKAEQCYGGILGAEQRYGQNSRLLISTLASLEQLARDRGGVELVNYYSGRLNALALDETRSKLASYKAVRDAHGFINFLTDPVRRSATLGLTPDKAYLPPTEARRLHLEALDLVSEVAPNSPQHAQVLVSLGHIERKEGDLRKALAFCGQAVEMLETLPLSHGMHFALSCVGYVALSQKDFDLAQRTYRRLAVMELPLEGKWGLKGLFVSFRQTCATGESLDDRYPRRRRLTPAAPVRVGESDKYQRG